MIEHYIFYKKQSRFSVYANSRYVEQNIFQYPLMNESKNSSFFFIDQYKLETWVSDKFFVTCFIADTTDDLLRWFENGGIFGFIKDEKIKEKSLYYLNVMIDIYENHKKNLSIQNQLCFPFLLKMYLFEDCISIANFIQKACHKYSKKDVLTGVHELLTNAMIHGNWALPQGFENKKQNLLAHRKKRFNDSFSKFVLVSGEIKGHLMRQAIHIKIEDMGEGFDWKNATIPLKTSYSGRGLIIAKEISFDELTYNDAGNCVTGYIYLD